MVNRASGIPLSHGDPNLLADLQTLVSTLGEDSRSPRTRRAYASAWRGFETWATAARLPALPATGETVALYLAHLYARGRRATTIEHALVAVSQKHLDANLPSPRADRQVGRVLRGIRRKAASAATPKAPLLPEHVEHIAASLPTTARGIRDRAIVTVGFATGLRRAELAALDVQDVRWGNGAAVLRIRRSKTDQEGAGRFVTASALPDSAACPVEALRQWIAVGSLEDGPLFRPVSRGDRIQARRLQERAVVRLVKAGVVRLGLDEKRFSGHSLRSGYATAASRAGTSDTTIMRALGHRTLEMTARYVRGSSGV